MPAPIKLLIPFDTLIDAIVALKLDDQILLRHILDQQINKTEENIEAFLIERGCQTPLKEGLPLTSEPARSGQINISTDHDKIMIQELEVEG